MTEFGIDWNSVFAVAKPIGIIGAFLGGIYMAAWALVQRSNLIKRDIDLNKDYNTLRLDNDALQARYNLMISRSQNLESNVKFLALSIVNMNSNVKALSDIITSLVKDDQRSRPLLLLVNNTIETFTRIKEEAEKMIVQANKELEYLRQQANQQQSELTQVQQQLAVRRETTEE